jgi:hypothetical protein
MVQFLHLLFLVVEVCCFSDGSFGNLQCHCSNVYSIIMYMGARLGTKEIMHCNIKAGFQ